MSASANRTHMVNMSNNMYLMNNVKGYKSVLKSAQKKLEKENKISRKLEDRITKNNLLLVQPNLSVEKINKLKARNVIFQDDLEFTKYSIKYWEEKIILEQNNLKKAEALKAKNKSK